MKIAKILLIALFSSSFIYLSHIQINYKTVDTVFALMLIYTLFTSTKKELFWGGFLTGILWFWWLGYSFVYYDLSILIPLVIIGIGLVYGLLFLFIGLFESIIYKTFYIFLLSFINPFGFNWFKIELTFINSFLGTSKLEFFSVICLTAFFIYLKRSNKNNTAILTYFSGIFLLFLNNSFANIQTADLPSLKIKLNSTYVDQDKKWQKEYQKDIIEKNFEDIARAINEKYDLIIFPETAFPLVLNKNEQIRELLLKRSKNIAILTGALNLKDQIYYNSSFLFLNGNMYIADKVVLVPFGEAVPLPQKIRDFINDTFYDGAKDYETAEKPTTFDINGIKFRNAICYEATTNKIFEDLDANYMIAISNNAWFTPSVQPTLQKLLLRYYSRKYNVTIFSVTNKSQSDIIF